MKITFWGTRGSLAAPGPDTVIYGGNTTCVEVTLASGRTVVIDAGTGIRRLGDAVLKRNNPADIHLLMTHVHWDHLLGFPFFGPLYDPHARIIVDGCGRGAESLKRIFCTADGVWPTGFEDIKAQVEERRDLLEHERLELGDALIESHAIQHPQGGYGFKFSESTGTFVFLTDNELIEGDRGDCVSKKDFLKFCRDADLLVHDCQYIPEEMHTHRGWGHSDLNSVAELAMEACVKRILLFHHDPWRTDREVENMVDRFKRILSDAGVSIEADAAREGSTVSV